MITWHIVVRHKLTSIERKVLSISPRGKKSNQANEDRRIKIKKKENTHVQVKTIPMC